MEAGRPRNVEAGRSVAEGEIEEDGGASERGRRRPRLDLSDCLWAGGGVHGPRSPFPPTKDRSPSSVPARRGFPTGAFTTCLTVFSSTAYLTARTAAANAPRRRRGTFASGKTATGSSADGS